MTGKSTMTEIALVKADIRYMKEKIDELHAKVVGNGKLGLCDEMSQIQGGIKTVQWVYGALIALLGVVVAMIAM